MMCSCQIWWEISHVRRRPLLQRLVSAGHTPVNSCSVIMYSGRMQNTPSVEVRSIRSFSPLNVCSRLIPSLGLIDSYFSQINSSTSRMCVCLWGYFMFRVQEVLFASCFLWIELEGQVSWAANIGRNDGQTRDEGRVIQRQWICEPLPLSWEHFFTGK